MIPYFVCLEKMSVSLCQEIYLICLFKGLRNVYVNFQPFITNSKGELIVALFFTRQFAVFVNPGCK